MNGNCKQNYKLPPCVGANRPCLFLFWKKLRAPQFQSQHGSLSSAYSVQWHFHPHLWSRHVAFQPGAGAKCCRNRPWPRCDHVQSPVNSRSTDGVSCVCGVHIGRLSPYWRSSSVQQPKRGVLCLFYLSCVFAVWMCRWIDLFCQSHSYRWALASKTSSLPAPQHGLTYTSPAKSGKPTTQRPTWKRAVVKHWRTSSLTTSTCTSSTGPWRGSTKQSTCICFFFLQCLFFYHVVCKLEQGWI